MGTLCRMKQNPIKLTGAMSKQDNYVLPLMPLAAFWLRRVFLILAFLPSLLQGARSTITGGECCLETLTAFSDMYGSVEIGFHNNCMTNSSAFWEEPGIRAAWRNNSLAINRAECILFLVFCIIPRMWSQRPSCWCRLSRTGRFYQNRVSKCLRLVLE